jgi:hypothetical protein
MFWAQTDLDDAEDGDETDEKDKVDKAAARSLLTLPAELKLPFR